MSRGAAVLRRSLGLLGETALDERPERCVVAALRAAAPGPNELLLAAGREAGLDERPLHHRAAVAFWNFAAFNLSDDLSDEECSYLDPRDAAVVLLTLNHLFARDLRRLDLGAGTEHEIYTDLLDAEQRQLEEIATERWDAPTYQRVADGIAGRQWAAYLRILWSGTTLAHEAPTIAAALGRLVLIGGDILSEDPRYFTLAPDDRREILAQGIEAADALTATGLGFVIGTVERLRPELEAHLVAPAAQSQNVSA